MTPIPVVPLLFTFEPTVFAIRLVPFFQPATIGTILAIVPVVVVTMVAVVVTLIIPVAIVPVMVLFLLLAQIEWCGLGDQSCRNSECDGQQPRSKRSKCTVHRLSSDSRVVNLPTGARYMPAAA